MQFIAVSSSLRNISLIFILYIKENLLQIHCIILVFLSCFHKSAVILHHLCKEGQEPNQLFLDVPSSPLFFSIGHKKSYKLVQLGLHTTEGFFSHLFSIDGIKIRSLVSVLLTVCHLVLREANLVSIGIALQ